jgi:hypothetical protein
MEFSMKDRTNHLTMQVRSYTMQSGEDTTYAMKHGRAPTGVSNPSPQLEAQFQADDETHEQAAESAAYTAEEEALVEERLKNLGYL